MLADFITENRAVIHYGQRLAAAGEDEHQRKAVLDQMKDTSQGQILLLRMNAAASRSTGANRVLLDRADEIAAEAQRAAMAREKRANKISYKDFKVLDLQLLRFQQGSRLMSNKKCTLPKGSTR